MEEAQQGGAFNNNQAHHVPHTGGGSTLRGKGRKEVMGSIKTAFCRSAGGQKDRGRGGGRVEGVGVTGRR